MADKQIDFPEMQKEDKRVTPFMLAFSVVCILVVIGLLLADVDGPFIGPWG